MSYGSLLVKHAVERLEGEPSQVARTSADATEGHLGHSLCREACDEAVAQVASAVDVAVGDNASSCSRCRKRSAPFGFAGFFDVRVVVVWVQARSSATGLNP